MSAALAEKLNALEAYSLGLQFVRHHDGTCGLVHLTVAYWRCENCKAVVEVASMFEHRMVIELDMGPEQTADTRLANDQRALVISREQHKCG